MSVVHWSAVQEECLPPMDDIHREFVELFNALVQSSDGEFLARLVELINHTIGHFDTEHRWMEQTGFPPIAIHNCEHDRALKMLHEVRERAEAGDIPLSRRLVEGVPVWFEYHAATLDSALASYLRNVGFDPAGRAAPA
jgi:hemerythrin-like metal-binding protein